MRAPRTAEAKERAHREASRDHDAREAMAGQYLLAIEDRIRATGHADVSLDQLRHWQKARLRLGLSIVLPLEDA